MNEIKINLDIRKIIPPKWWFVFTPWRWNYFFIYKKRYLKPVFTIESPTKFPEIQLYEKDSKQ